MILQGKNLYVMADGVVLAGAKSCDVQVDCETIPVSSPSDGSWENSIAGRKSWSVTTNHLVLTRSVPTSKVEAVATTHNGSSLAQTSYCVVDGSRYAGGTRGLTLHILEHDAEDGWERLSSQTYDTYASTDACAAMAEAIGDITSGQLVCITSFDACAINSTLAQAIATKLLIPVAFIPTFTAGRVAIAIVGVAGYGGIAKCDKQVGGTAYAQLLLDVNYIPMTDAPIKNFLTKTGTTVTLQLQVDGFANDRLSGTAICKTGKITATHGNLLTGGWTWKGSGPLQ